MRVEIAFHPPEIVETPAPEELPKKTADVPPPPPALQNKIEDVVVRGERVEPGRTATLSRTEVRQIPGVFGDPFRAIEIMPGVTHASVPPETIASASPDRTNDVA